MLVLTRLKGEEVVITLPDGRQIVVTVLTAERDRARLGFTGPLDVQIDRREVHEAKKAVA